MIWPLDPSHPNGHLYNWPPNNYLCVENDIYIYIYPSLFSFRFFLLTMTCTKHLTTRATHFAKASEASLSGNQVASITAKLLLFALSSLSSHLVDTTDWEDWTEDMIRLINERVRQLVTEVLETRNTSVYEWIYVYLAGCGLIAFIARGMRSACG